MKIYNFGSMNIDRVYSVKHFVRPGETLSSDTYSEFAGGKGLNQSIALARAGVNVCHIGKIGHDGTFLRNYLKENEVDTSHIFLSDEPTGHAIIQVDSGGENAILLFGGANQSITAKEIRSALEPTNKGDWLLLQNEINGIEEIILRGAEKELKIIFNPAPMTADVPALPLEKVSYLIVNESEGEMLSNQKSPEKILDVILSRFPHISVILTLGKRGVFFADKSHRLFVPAEKIIPVDTTGAGDTFIGYYLSGLVSGNSIEACLHQANKAAAICVSRSGAAESIPYLNELNR